MRSNNNNNIKYIHMTFECFNDWGGGGGGYDDSVPGEVAKTTLSVDRTTGSPTWSASLPRIQLISPGGWPNKAPVGAIFVLSLLLLGTYLCHPHPPQLLNDSSIAQSFPTLLSDADAMLSPFASMNADASESL